MVSAQQPPERARVALHAVRAAHDEDRRVQHRERALRLTGEIHMARRIEKRYGAVFPGEPRLLRDEARRRYREAPRKASFSRRPRARECRCTTGSFPYLLFPPRSFPLSLHLAIYYITKDRILQ